MWVSTQFTTARIRHKNTTNETFKNCLQKLSFADVLYNRSSLKCPNIHRKTPLLDSLFNKVAGPQTCNFIKKWLQHRRFPENVSNFLRTAFSMEHLRWLLLCLFEREEEESVEQRSKKKKFKCKKQMKTFYLTSTCKFWC